MSLQRPVEELVCRSCCSQELANLVGESPLFLKSIEQLPAIAKSQASVLISGETGTGKELVAQLIHQLGTRAAFAFVAVNCGSFSDALLEDELFGHERGAFTGAERCRNGLIAQAQCGTLFLDEVDTMPPKAQIDLLRVLQDKKFRTIGSTLERDADVRVVAATNVALDQLVRTNNFRADLYYRLRVFSINLPPLRDRREDITRLAAYFLKKHAPLHKPMPKLAPNALAALMSRDWPGNVRELENTIIRAVHLSQGDFIELADLGLQSGFERPLASIFYGPGKLPAYRTIKREAVALFEKDYLTRLMAEHIGNVTRAARSAGKDRSDLGKLLKKHGVDARVFRLRGIGLPE
jgi:DNA-binding NtrC family response regulator